MPAGSTARGRAGYITVTGSSAPVTTTSPSPSSSGSDTGGGPAPAAAAQPAPAVPAVQPAVQPVVAPVAPQPVVAAPLPANNPGIAEPVAAQSYPMGFQGMSYNANGQNTLRIDTGAAQAAGATVTVYFDHIDVYQHHSPGVHLMFWGNHFDIRPGKITANISRAEFVTDPMNATLAFGNVSGSVHAELPALIQRVSIDTTIPGNVSTDTLNRFRTFSAATVSGWIPLPTRSACKRSISPPARRT